MINAFIARKDNNISTITYYIVCVYTCIISMKWIQWSSASKAASRLLMFLGGWKFLAEIEIIQTQSLEIYQNNACMFHVFERSHWKSRVRSRV